MADEQFLCPFEAIAKNVKIKGLETFRNQIRSASKNIRCDYPEFNTIRKRTNILLENIDKEIELLRK